jgi:hypothetical protein
VTLRTGFEDFYFGAIGRDGRSRKLKKENVMTNTTNQPATSKAPSHLAYHVTERKGGKAFWALIGSAWEHADGKGFNIQIASVPLDGRVALRVLSENKE